MRIAIIGAMKEEIEIIKHNIIDMQIEEDIFTYYTGKISDKEVVLVNSGVGKVASGILLTALLYKYTDVKKIINLGVAGGIKGKVNPLDVVIGEELAYFDADATAFNHYVYGQIPGCPKKFIGNSNMLKILKEKDISCKYGMILSGDKFVTESNNVSKIINEYFNNNNVLAVDMESCAFAQTAWVFKKDFLAIRAISDIIGDDNQKDKYENILEVACLKSSNVVLEIIKSM